MLFYTTTMNNTECTKCPVATGTHKPAEAVHQIAEPQPDALALAECLQKDVWQATPLRLSKVVELSAETLIAQRARIAELEDYKAFFNEWIAKTNWVQDSGIGNPGEHRADVMKRRIAELEKAESDLINQRDHCEEIIDRMADAVLGKDRPEWSSNYDFIDAAQEVEDRVAELQEKAAAPQAVQAAVPVVRGEVLVTVSGFTGSGKSAIAGEIEIMCRALGLQVEWPDGVTEKNMTHADWTTALELYNPRVRIIERNVPRNTASGADQ